MRPSPSQLTPPAEPRSSASIAVINARNEVLLVQRNPKTRSFAGVHVFPGGNLDPAQDGGSLAMIAIRETFEESGLLLASPSSTTTASASPIATISSTNSTSTTTTSTSFKFPPPTVLEAARYAIHAQRTNFSEFLAKEGLRADVDALLPFTEWVTPVEQPRRFRTKFFLAFLPSASSSTTFTAGDKQEQIPTPDGGQEVISARFVRPADALAEFEAGRISFMPPQFYILTTLAGIFGGGDGEAVDARSKIERLARGPFGRMVFNPQRLDAADATYPKSSVEEGETVLTYEGDEARGGPRGRRHRAVVRFAQGGITTRIRLERNFDIFEGIDGAPSSSKL